MSSSTPLALIPSAGSCCPVCRDPYDSRMSRMTLLSCLHPICAACLRLARDLLVSLGCSSTSKTSSGRDRTIGTFLCPFCHTKTAVKEQEWEMMPPIKPQNGEEKRRPANWQRRQSVLQAALQELHSRRGCIQDAIEGTEIKKCEALRLAQQMEGAIAITEERRLHLRASKLKIMSKILERLCVLKQSYDDIDFLCTQFSSLLLGASGGGGSNNNGVKEDEVATSIAGRLNAIGDVLAKLDSLPSLDPLTMSPLQAVRKCCLDLSVPLYERVLCRVPVVFLDESGQQVYDLCPEDVCIDMIINNLEFARASLSCESHRQLFQFSTHSAGLARVKVRVGGKGGSELKVFPDSFIVLPLTLESSLPTATNTLNSEILFAL